MGGAKPALNGGTQLDARSFFVKREWRLAVTVAFNGERTTERRRLQQLLDDGMQQIDQASKVEIHIGARTSEGPVMLGYRSLPARCRPRRQSGEISLTKFDRRTSANMEVVLNEMFEGVPHGGDHESRKYVAERLLRSARKGNVTLEGLRAAGRTAFRRLSTRRSADAVSVTRERAPLDQSTEH